MAKIDQVCMIRIGQIVFIIGIGLVGLYASDGSVKFVI